MKAKTYSYLINHGSKDKKVKGTKNRVIKRKLKFQDDKNYLEESHTENKLKHLEKKMRLILGSLKKDHKEK